MDYGRGAFARQPAQRSLAEFLDDHCPRLAAAIAYHVLFSLFPLAIMLAGVFGIVVHATGARAPSSTRSYATCRSRRGATGGSAACCTG